MKAKCWSHVMMMWNLLIKIIKNEKMHDVELLNHILYQTPYIHLILINSLLLPAHIKEKHYY